MNPSSTSSSELLVRALGFVALGIGLAYALNAVLVGSLRRSTEGEYGFRHAVVAGALASDIAIVGSSRAFKHFDCELIGAELHRTCVNLGVDGMSSSQQLPLLQLYLAHTAPPKLLVIEVDLTSLEQQRRPLAPQLDLAYASDEAFYPERARLDPTFWAARHVPLYGFASGPLDGAWDAVIGLVKHGPPLPTIRRGAVTEDKPWDGTFDELQRAHPEGTTFEITADGKRAVDRLLALGLEHGTKVAMVFSPELDEAHDVMKNEDEVLAELARIAKARGVPFFDWSHDALTHDRSLFYNSQHLNARGAERFSRGVVPQLASVLSP